MFKMLNRPSWRTVLAWGILAGTLLVIGLRFYRDLSGYFDLNEADEGAYLYRGLLWAFWDEPLDRVWGPLYSAWYGGLSHLMAPEAAYYVNAYIATLLPPALLALWVYRQTGQALWAWVVSLGYLVSWGNHNDWRINHWLLIWVLLGWLILPREPHRLLHPRTWLLLAWMTWGLSYIRPEMMLTSLLFAAGSLLLLGFHHPASSRGIALGSWMGYLVLLLLFFGIAWRTHPWKDPQGRSLAAFGQHFAVRWKARTQGDFNPYTDWPHVLKAEFGELGSIGDAFRKRPDLMAWFIRSNLLTWGRVVAQRLTPYPWRYAWKPWGLSLLSVGLALMLTFFLKAKPHRRSFLLWSTFFALWTLPFFGSAWLIYPRPHYLVVPLALGWGLLGYLGARVLPLSPRVQWSGLLSASVLFALFLPKAYGPQPRPLYYTVRLLRTTITSTSSPLVVYESWHPAFFYLADRVRPQEIQAWSQQETPSWPLLSRTSVPPEVWLENSSNEISQGEYNYEPITLPDGSLWWVRSDLTSPLGGSDDVQP